MKPTTTSSLDNARIPVTVYTRCLLERLARKAGMDWFLTESRNRLTLTGSQVTRLADAFTRQNLGEFSDEEILTILTWYARLNFATAGMSREVIGYFRGIPGEDPVTVTCRGQREEWKSRAEALAFYRQGVRECDGSERERYLQVVLQLESGVKDARDE
jgi:hypothetical protein